MLSDRLLKTFLWLTILEEEESQIMKEVDDTTDVNVILLPPTNGLNSGHDDAPSDDDSSAQFMSLGKGV